ncbi:MAG: SWF/SNF helicase family protein [Mollicutes bacterium]|nr:SWF/SNF helicase family protein [Mollicutes bacterium]
MLSELPDKIESEEWCTLDSEEENIYEESIMNRKYQDARRVSWNVNDLNKSSKASRLKEIVEDAEKEGRKVLVFSFFLDTINKIYNFLKNKCLFPINGSVSVDMRQQIVDEFNKAPAGTVLLAQINTGGTGLNIQAASVIVMCEPQYKPSIENQAISRAYRMGQSRNVLVYRLLVKIQLMKE